MLKRVLLVWAIANFGMIGLVSAIAGGWYLGWSASPFARMMAELGLIMVPNFLLPVLVLRYWWPERYGEVKSALGWKWNGWRSLFSGILGFMIFLLIARVVRGILGDSIPYNLPGETGEGSAITIQGPLDILKILGLLLGLLAFVLLTVAGEETMFRGWIQTQIGRRYGAWIGLLLAALLFGLRHLPADLFYAQIWQATPQMWLSRQSELYLAALGLGLARHYGQSTYAPAIMHGLILIAALFGIG